MMAGDCRRKRKNAMTIKAPDTDNKIAVLIDADNTQKQRLKTVLDRIAAHGRIITKMAYGNWSSEELKGWQDTLNTLAIQPKQQVAYTNGKNASDIAMVIDAMNLLYAGGYDASALISSDSDFTRLAITLRDAGLFVFGVGEAQTPAAFRNACDYFILTEKLVPVPAKSKTPAVENNAKPAKALATESNSESAQSKAQPANSSAPPPKAGEAVDLLRRAWKKCRQDDGWVKLSPAGKVVRELRPNFEPGDYGVKRLSDLIRKHAGHFHHKGEGSALMYKPR